MSNMLPFIGLFTPLLFAFIGIAVGRYINRARYARDEIVHYRANKPTSSDIVSRLKASIATPSQAI